jgi:hypothetical protein
VSVEAVSAEVSRMTTGVLLASIDWVAWILLVARVVVIFVALLVR